MPQQMRIESYYNPRRRLMLLQLSAFAQSILPGKTTWSFATKSIVKSWQDPIKIIVKSPRTPQWKGLPRPPGSFLRNSLDVGTFSEGSWTYGLTVSWYFISFWRDFKPQKLLLVGGFKIQLFFTKCTSRGYAFWQTYVFLSLQQGVVFEVWGLSRKTWTKKLKFPCFGKTRTWEDL